MRVDSVRSPSLRRALPLVLLLEGLGETEYEAEEEAEDETPLWSPRSGEGSGPDQDPAPPSSAGE